MSSHDDAATAPSPASLLRWLVRLTVVDLGLLFIVDGLDARWSAVAADVLTVCLVVLLALLVMVGLLHLSRRGRRG